MIQKLKEHFSISECASPLVARKERMRVDAEKRAGAHLDDLNCHSDALRFLSWYRGADTACPAITYEKMRSHAHKGRTYSLVVR